MKLEWCDMYVQRNKYFIVITSLALMVQIGNNLYLSDKLVNILITVTHFTKLLTASSSHDGKFKRMYMYTKSVMMH